MREGYAVALNYARDRNGAAGVMEEARAVSPSAVALQADASRPEECGRLVLEAIRKLGHLDVLVNNVGPFLERPLGETTDAEWREMIDGNLGSALWCSPAVLPSMRERRTRRIVDVSALNAEGSPGMTHEAAAHFLAQAAPAMMTQ